MFTFDDLKSMELTGFAPFSPTNKFRGKIVYFPEKEYFTILNRAGKNIEVMSNNTGHCWNLIYEKDCYTIMHKHELSDPYHYQTCIGSLYDVVLYIVGHDEYQMRNRHNVSVEEEKRSGSYFWKLIDIYGLTA
ncbi:hypothetical protein [Diplocloster agilis]|uniref:hypothetical protein n=1 Tax=Diplocloster agilis TaxID=2850323 RepID=UPI0008232667|nr:hypothetical protein [Suonthocola fibrivorans]MCU6732193.1 hypothetical protein [Suonthocola fibrivorans]SCI36489.1 Uncharacterised protein [uncultured Clostridium sp.]